MHRPSHLRRAQTEHFDVCIIGGGATGAGCALDAALRGLKVCLIEREDFAAQTSSKSTKLIHGGVRYLEQAFKRLDWEQFQLVRKGLWERKYLLQNAPHLTRPMALLTPCHSRFERLYFGVGLKLYDLLAGRHNLTPSRQLSTEEALRAIPTLKKESLRGAVQYYDGQLDDARFALALVRTAAQHGAVVLNHAEVQAFEASADGKLQTLIVRDLLDGQQATIRATVFVNATGPFADGIRQMANPAVPSRMRVSKGVHVILPKTVLNSETALLVPQTDDGRVMFVIPWKNHVLVGTTDTEADLGDDPALEQTEVDYLLGYVRRYLNSDVSAADVQSGFAGLRPLLQADPSTDTKTLVRDHEVEIDARSGLVSIMGGKWTTYRLMARDTIDACLRRMNAPPRPCTTETQLLVGAEGYTSEGWQELITRYGLPKDVAVHLWHRYGIEAEQVAALTKQQPAWANPLVENYPFLVAEVVFAVRHEMACTVSDVLSRRLGLEDLDWQATEAALPAAINLMAEQLDWSESQAHQAESDYRQRLFGIQERALFKQKSTA
ncbi:MAG: FAD-dependent oxidoreductase [Cytophagaceae bacterium]|nr:FAD-dependent oxidoreductase [Cytophagaceae bacterium]